jgi:hypothetical protein
MFVMLAPGSLNHIANIVKGYAIAIGIAFAMYVVWRWWQTRVREAAADRAARARSVWARHLAQALQHPELAEPMLGSLASPVEVARYRYFVAGLLAAADEVMALEPGEAWRATLARHLAPHRSYLASAEARETVLKDCSDATRSVVKSVAAA